MQGLQDHGTQWPKTSRMSHQKWIPQVRYSLMNLWHAAAMSTESTGLRCKPMDCPCDVQTLCKHMKPWSNCKWSENFDSNLVSPSEYLAEPNEASSKIGSHGSHPPYFMLTFWDRGLPAVHQSKKTTTHSRNFQHNICSLQYFSTQSVITNTSGIFFAFSYNSKSAMRCNENLSLAPGAKNALAGFREKPRMDPWQPVDPAWQLCQHGKRTPAPNVELLYSNFVAFQFPVGIVLTTFW